MMCESPVPACVVPGCQRPAVAEVHCDLPKIRKTVKLVHVYACIVHINDPELNRRLQHPQWQQLLFV